MKTLLSVGEHIILPRDGSSCTTGAITMEHPTGAYYLVLLNIVKSGPNLTCLQMSLMQEYEDGSGFSDTPFKVNTSLACQQSLPMD